MRIFLILLIGSFGNCFSQTDSAALKMDSIDSSPIFFPSTIATHPFGVFISRINHNFQSEAEKTGSIAFNISSGNVWLPYVKGYMPLNEPDIAAMEKIIWSAREYSIDLLNTPAKTIDLHADGIIRLYQLKLSVPVSEKWELKVNARAFSVDPGNFPFSSLTSDQFIEWFHSTIKGGEDPFARKDYGFNKTKIAYTDRDGKTLYLSNGDFIFSGIELYGYYYPQINSLIKRNIYVNLGLLTGINVSKTNPSLDIGFNSSIIKKISLGSKSKLDLAISAGVLRQKVLVSCKGVQITSNKFLFTSEFLLSYQRQTGNGSQISIGTTYYIQSPYNNKEEYKSIILTGERITTHWHYSLSHLYRMLTYNTLFISYSKGPVSLTGYLKEDLLVDNAPDVQTGVAVKVNF